MMTKHDVNTFPMDEVYNQHIHFHPLTNVQHLQPLTILLQLVNNSITNCHLLT
jgi:hypothetical protein